MGLLAGDRPDSLCRPAKIARLDGGRIFLPATFDTAAAEVVTITAGERLVSTLTVPPPSRLEGTITGSWGPAEVNSSR